MADRRSKSRTASRRPSQGVDKVRRTGGRSARVRAAVLKHAFRLFIEKGLAAFSIAEVAVHAGVHETSIYRRWSDKTALLLDACLEFSSASLTIPDHGTLREDLTDFLGQVIRLVRAPEGKVLLALSLADDPAAVAARRAFWLQRFATAAVIVERGKTRGEVAADTDPLQMLEVLIAPFYFRTLVSLQPLQDWPIGTMIDREIAGRRPNSARIRK